MRHVVGDVPLGGSPFPPIADYAFLSDCEVCALVAPSGNVEWMCLPRFDGPSIFGAMLDRDAGVFRLAPGRHRGARRPALPAGDDGPRDDVGHAHGLGHRPRRAAHRALAPRRRALATRTGARRPTTTPTTSCCARCAASTGASRCTWSASRAWTTGASASRGSTRGAGYGKAVGTRRGRGRSQLTLTTDLRLGFEGGRARARTTLRDGDTAFVALSWSDHGGPETYDDAYHRLVFTADYWHEWLSHGEFPDHPWRTYLQRSALTLKGLTYAPTGAMIAAATTSLPETPGGERNWDYRYAWIRDSTFMLWGLYTLGFDEEANDFFYFIRDVASKTDDELQIMYGIGGEETLTEEMLLHLDGYEHAQPVRVGNGAYAQKQHDVWGALLDSIYLHTKSRDGLAESTWEILRKQVDARDRRTGASPTAGSGRCAASPSTSPPRRSCAGSPATAARAWRACARTTSAAERWQARGRRDPRRHLRARHRRARRLHASTTTPTALDASCLLIPLVRFLPPDDERVVATVNAIADELTLNGLVQRYKVEETDDGLAGEEGTFAICSFWLVSALAEIGEHDRARALCEKMLGFASQPATSTPRRSTRAPGATWATSRRPSPTWPSSTPSCTSSAPTTTSPRPSR